MPRFDRGAAAASPVRRWRAPRFPQIVGLILVTCTLIALVQYSLLNVTASGQALRASEQRGNAASVLSDAADHASPPSKAIREPTVRVRPGSKGIIMCLHNGIIPLGASLVRELRCLGNREPIEVYHCQELSRANQAILHQVDADLRIVDVCADVIAQGVMDEALAHSFRSYWIKPLALHQTRFQHVIMLDADVIALHDPAVLRDITGYKTKGTVFFYDRVIWDENFFNRRYTPEPGAKAVQYLPYWLEHFDYARFNLTYGPSQTVLESMAYHRHTCHEMDSSMVLVDKARAGQAMAILWFLITEHRFDVEFSLGDKESFWLAYEFAHAPYYFSPWGASVVASEPNHDVDLYQDGTLCGSLCHFMPVDDPTPQLLYVNGKAVVDPIPFPMDRLPELRPNLVFNLMPNHMTPRQKRAAGKPTKGKSYHMECNVGLGATPTPPELRNALWRRRMHFMAISMNLFEPLQSCDLGGKPKFFS